MDRDGASSSPTAGRSEMQGLARGTPHEPRRTGFAGSCTQRHLEGREGSRGAHVRGQAPVDAWAGPGRAGRRGPHSGAAVKTQLGLGQGVE